ncbi:hypothetical protein ACFVNB_08965 [Streptomyces rochei]|uniref:hypothetical protein n=1 Tax=Streptomyces rochei TaxID=1928 RepID=UPI0036B2C618
MDQYAADFAVIEQDLTEAQSLEFGAYAGYLAHYGSRLHRLAAEHADPMMAFRILQRHADEFLEGLNQ